MPSPTPITDHTGDQPVRAKRLESLLRPDLPDMCVQLVYRHRRLFLAFVLLLYALGFNGQWRIEPDAALYLSLGRNLAQGRGYTHLGKPHHLAYPGLPWIIDGTFQVFGSSHLWPALVLMLGFALVTLLLVYRLFATHTDKPTAFFITMGVAVTKTFFRYGYELRPDMPFLFGLMAFLCGYESIFGHPERPRTHRWYDWVLLGGGLAIATMMRPTIWVVVLAIALAIGWSTVRGHLRWRTLVPFLLGIALLLIAFRHVDPRMTSRSGADDYDIYAWQSLTTHLGATLHMVLHQNLYQLLAIATPDSLMQVRLGYPNILLGIIFIVLGVALVRVHVLWGLLVALVVVMNVLVPPLDRYYLPVIPLMVYGWWLGVRAAFKHWPHPATYIIVGILVVLGVGSNLEKMGGIIIEQRSIPFLAYYQDGKFKPLMKLAADIKRKVSPKGLVLVQHADGRILSYLSERNVADRRDFAGLQLTGRPLLVVEPMDDNLRELLAEHHLVPGATVATVHGGPRGVYTLRRVVPLKQSK